MSPNIAGPNQKILGRNNFFQNFVPESGFCKLPKYHKDLLSKSFFLLVFTILTETEICTKNRWVLPK